MTTNGADTASGGPDGFGEKRIQVLSPEVARKIAAGEVVDRPAALVREFIDNAIDAGSSLIELTIEEGGSRRTEIADDGGGMARGDLELCWHTHATSKIRDIDDLGRALTLGFRGEALAAAAAVSRLEILSSPDGREAWSLYVSPGGERSEIRPGRRQRGTTVRALGLFDAIPARKRFLKREGTEAGLCKQALIDKALAFPSVSFRFVQDGNLKLFLPPAESLKERFSACLLSQTEENFLHEIHASGEGFSVSVVTGGPELWRKDRRQQYVFANGRRIQEFSLLQALEYGVQGWFPNGVHPVGAVYVQIDPALADFNIHPAKREVRFKDSGAIHHAITTALTGFVRHGSLARGAGADGEFRAGDGQGGQSGPGGYDSHGGYGGGSGAPRNTPDDASARLALEALLENRPGFARAPRMYQEGAAQTYPEYGSVGEQSAAYAADIHYLGKVFGLFLLAEKGDRLYIIDQHAAHERLLFEKLLAGTIPVQELLVPLALDTGDDEEDSFLERKKDELARLGIVLGKEDGQWSIEALPAAWKADDGETAREILNLKNSGGDLARSWAASLSCHEAIKEGDYLDPLSALELAAAALALPDPRCPHGRPLWVEISKEELLRGVRRT
ncbi:MAG: DNA mismatch repair endonuclease MutL [Spirochaetaceae bacterium]|jgi:DNA mismatch repair protein MutL|nr:DNA mismatch repair endonuclease MutL [Spirochaetaceae bacterium]